MEENDIGVDEKAKYISTEKYILAAFKLCETTPLGTLTFEYVLVS